MQTNRHRIFAALAVCAVGCKPRPVAAPTTVPAAEPAPQAQAEEAAEPEEPAPEPPKRKKMTRKAEPVVGAPVIKHARLTSPRTLSLHFNEPVVVAEGFDPRQFRLSFSQSYTEEDGYSSLYYYDPAAIEDPELSSDFLDIVVESDLTIRLELSRPLSRDICEEAADMMAEAAQDPTANGGLFLHYRDEPESGIEDTEGNRLENIAPHWIERRATSTSYIGQRLAPIAAHGPVTCGF